MVCLVLGTCTEYGVGLYNIGEICDSRNILLNTLVLLNIIGLSLITFV